MFMPLNPYEPPQAQLLDRAKRSPAPPTLWELCKRGLVVIVAGLLGAAIMVVLVRSAVLFGLGPAWGAIIICGSMALAVTVAAYVGLCTARSRRWWRWIEGQVLIIVLVSLFNLLAPAISVPRTPARMLVNPNNLKTCYFRESPIHAPPTRAVPAPES
jgi:hypothetical protein